MMTYRAIEITGVITDKQCVNVDFDTTFNPFAHFSFFAKRMAIISDVRISVTISPRIHEGDVDFNFDYCYNLDMKRYGGMKQSIKEFRF